MDLVGRLGIAFGCAIAACVGALLAAVLVPAWVLAAALAQVAGPARAAYRAIHTRWPATARNPSTPGVD